MHKKNLSLRSTGLILAAGLGLYLLSWLSLRTLTFFTTDTGLRLLQMQALIESNWQSFAIPYPYRTVDPDLAHVPYYYAYLLIDEHVYLALSPFFLYVGSWLYAALGTWGLPVLPVLGTVLTALAVAGLVYLSRLPGWRWVFLGTMFATPLLFYSLELWDHTFGLLFAVGGLYGAAAGLRHADWRLMLLGGIGLGLATGQRPELHLFAVAVGLSWFLVAGRQWWGAFVLATGGLLGVLPLWFLQWRWFGHVLGPVTGHQLFGYGRPEVYPFEATGVGDVRKIGYFLTYIEPRDWLSFSATLLVVVGGVLILYALQARGSRQPVLLWPAFGLAAMGYALFLILSWRVAPTGLLPTFPLLFLALLYVPPRLSTESTSYRIYRLVLFSMLLYLLGMLIIWPAYGGWQWGARYLLAVYPLAIYLAWYAYQTYWRVWGGARQQSFRRLALGLAGLSLICQLFGAVLLYRIHYQQVTLLATLDALPVELILTNNPRFPTRMTGAASKTFLYVPDQSQMETIMNRLRDQGVPRVGIVAFELVPLDSTEDWLTFQPADLTLLIHNLANETEVPREP